MFLTIIEINLKEQKSSCKYSDYCLLMSCGFLHTWCLITLLTLPRPPSCFSEPVASVPPQSDVYRMLHDNRDEPTQPRQSGSFRVLQELVNDDDRPAGTRSVRAPVTKVHGGAGSTQKMPFCDKCGSGIVGAVVKARDKYRHPECFVCADCNLNLKQKGYFFVEGELYCETHARARTRPPEGYDTVTLYPRA